jgi:hypothetical protein
MVQESEGSSMTAIRGEKRVAEILGKRLKDHKEPTVTIPDIYEWAREEGIGIDAVTRWINSRVDSGHLIGIPISQTYKVRDNAPTA